MVLNGPEELSEETQGTDICIYQQGSEHLQIPHEDMLKVDEGRSSDIY